ncbi:uncharacterized protein Z519_04648 [Cladophialophora bantiana CBS 173.52]|uniref:Major facilitator superfamily (MFS) profile domain-containing protein n=1 Tax=Cladophialophora bantiana (strain ATCC 10958 / CBS 173.52 / CDC B-1940 / NIH 8579) TaxID=1442370 RepID=A0A0D2EXJ3_CLAB1|nr:uncharacterized protein Z519_04648 [Cladophialophora bantiana CBS 173.52]KIW94671.1 hypothetical protein Z519_04648 [Cladophialophora bantiana CBS 173.52]
MSQQEADIDAIEVHYSAAPGTEILYDVAEDGTGSSKLHRLQHVKSKSGDGHLLLVPQPSLTDPNDPLRWSTMKKWTTFLNALGFSFMGSVTGPIMTGWMVEAAAFYNTSIQRMSYTVGATLICQGCATALWMPFAVKFGRRPVYLFSNLLMGVACIWLASASKTTYTSFLVGRAFLGVFEAPMESIVPSTVTDMFFLHDRGAKVSYYGLSVLGGNELGPMLSALIIQSLGMAWAFYIVAIFIFANSVTQFFFMPETMYLGPRPSLELHEDKPDEKGRASAHIEITDADGAQVPKKTFLQELSFWGINDHSVSLWQAFARPFVLLAYPTVVWSCCCYGMALSWNVILATTNGQLFSPPPYSFNAAAQGLVFGAPLIGSLVGTYLCGPVADSIANYFTRRNHGIREPEMRLPTCIIAAMLTFIGALISALCFHYKTRWIGPVMGYGILSAGSQMGSTLAMSYALDCHKELSVELMVTIASLKSAVAWIWTWVVNDWLNRNGPLVVLLVVMAINIAVYASSFLLYRYGKSIRMWLHHKNFLGACGLA